MIKLHGMSERLLIGQGQVKLYPNSDEWVTPQTREAYAQTIKDNTKASLMEVAGQPAWRQRVKERLSALTVTCAATFTRVTEEPKTVGMLALAPSELSAMIIVGHLHLSQVPLSQDLEALIYLGMGALGFIGGYTLYEACLRLAQHSAVERITRSTNQ